MPQPAQTIVDNFHRIRERVARAAEQSGRSASNVQLVAVTKYVDAELTAALLNAGADQLGESRPQQLWEKAKCPTLQEANWHMIGHLQRNKVRRTVPLVGLIHSVDSQRLMTAIDETARDAGMRSRVLLEVNTSGDAAKHGLTADELQELASQLANFPHVDVRGLMTMAARDGGTTVASRNFVALRELRDQLAVDLPAGTTLNELSMGMSHDFEEAIREGATLVRIGSLLTEGLA